MHSGKVIQKEEKINLHKHFKKLTWQIQSTGFEIPVKISTEQRPLRRATGCRHPGNASSRLQVWHGILPGDMQNRGYWWYCGGSRLWTIHDRSFNLSQWRRWPEHPAFKSWSCRRKNTFYLKHQSAAMALWLTLWTEGNKIALHSMG